MIFTGNKWCYQDQLAHIKVSGQDIKFVPKELITDELCMAAVEQSSWALGYVPDEFKTQAMCLSAVTRNGWAMRDVPIRHNTQEIVLTALRENNDALQYARLPVDNVLSDVSELTTWNTILSELNPDEVDIDSTDHADTYLVRPLIWRMNEAKALAPEITDQIEILIEHTERLEFHGENLREAYVEKIATLPKQSKHKRGAILTI